METLLNAIGNTPIIDHHAHNLLLPNEVKTRPLLSITTEAEGEALSFTTSTTSHIRAVKQLSEILGCADTWDSVQAVIAEKRNDPDDAWAQRCFEGIETALIDDGLNEKTVHPYSWHSQFTRSKCKRIVRIEKVAETILKKHLAEKTPSESRPSSAQTLAKWQKAFIAAIKNAIHDEEVAGFKSIICYRTGLAVAGAPPNDEILIAATERILSRNFTRLEDHDLSPLFVHLTARLISESTGHHKPLQFHTGLGDNDITLSLASPSHLQPFIKAYPKVPIVLLHASYPFTKEAGYLAGTYGNVYLDIGEVFPMVSQDGQENVIRESLELCPSEKLCWSTDGHWFPETYLLAVVQVREAMKQVR
jgi:predicted TIM-barrel fold metal-dependent hydrolase